MAKAPEPAFSSNRIVKFIDARLEELKLGGKTASDVAREAGYQHPNIVSMFRTGKTKVPLDKVMELARAMEVDPAILLGLALEQFWPKEAKGVSELLNRIVTANEFAIIEHIRSASNHTDPELTAALTAELDRVFSKR